MCKSNNHQPHVILITEASSQAALPPRLQELTVSVANPQTGKYDCHFIDMKITIVIYQDHHGQRKAIIDPDWHGGPLPNPEAGQTLVEMTGQLIAVMYGGA